MMYSKLLFSLVVSLAGSAATAVTAGCPVWTDGAPRTVSIPAQRLDLSLQVLATQAGVDILFEPSTVGGLEAEALHGRMGASDALCRLLQGSGLEYRINSDQKVLILRKPITSAALYTQQLIAQLPLAGQSAYLAQGEGAVAPPPVAGDDLADSEAADDRMTEVIVTGTRQRDRTVAESPVPVDVIGAEALQTVGSTDTNKVLSVLVPSFNLPQPSITGGTDIIRPATLRGLAPDHTLVLVNGKRRHVSALLNINGSVGRGSAAVDISMLPTAAIKRVEVLRDGAAAQYGSDAIAGVINLLLNDSRDGGHFTANYGEYDTSVDGAPEASGILTQANGQPVLTPDGVFALQYGADRKVRDGEVLTLAGNLGLPLWNEGFLNVSAQYRDRARANRAGYDPRRQYPLLPGGAVDPRELTFDRLSHRFGDAEIEDLNLVVNAGIPVANDAAEWYGFGTYGTRDGLTEGFYRQALDGRVVTSIFPDGMLPQVLVDLDDAAFATGARGALADWNYDASVNYGRNSFDFVTANSNNASLGALSPTRFDAGGLTYSQYSGNLDVQRGFDVFGLRNPLSVALGLEYRSENFEVRAGDEASYVQGPVLLPNGQPAAAGAQVFPGFRPDNATDRGRHSWSAYVDLEADITDRWSVTLAGRGEEYSDFGSDLNYKAATRFELTEGLALRGGVSTGFRAPSLHQQFFSTTSTNNVAGRLVDVGTFAVTDGAARALGARDLEPENSFSVSAGVVFDLLDGLNVTADYFRIDIDDRIVLTENLGASGTPEQNAAVQAVLGNAGFTSISGARFFINGLDTRTEGVDVVATYDVPTSRFGDLRLTAGYNYTKTEIERFINELGPLAQIPGLVLFGRLESERIERGQPKSKLGLSADWTIGGFSATLRGNRYGEVFAPGVDPRDDLTIEPTWVTDLEVRYLIAGLQVALGAENLFDEYPTAAPTGPRPASLGGNYTVNNYILPFSGFSPFGFNGRFIYGRATYRF